MADSMNELVRQTVRQELARIARPGELYALSEDETMATANVVTKWGDSGEPVGYEEVTGPYTHPRLGSDNAIWSRPTVRGKYKMDDGREVWHPHRRGEAVYVIQPPGQPWPVIITGLTLTPDGQNPASDLLAALTSDESLLSGDPRPQHMQISRELPSTKVGEYYSDIIHAVLGDDGSRTVLKLRPGVILAAAPQPFRTNDQDDNAAYRVEYIEQPLALPNSTDIDWQLGRGDRAEVVGNYYLRLQSDYWSGALSDLTATPVSGGGNGFYLYGTFTPRSFIMPVMRYRVVVPESTSILTLTATVNDGGKYDLEFVYNRSDGTRNTIPGTQGVAQIDLHNSRNLIQIRTLRDGRLKHRYILQVQPR